MDAKTKDEIRNLIESLRERTDAAHKREVELIELMRNIHLALDTIKSSDSLEEVHGIACGIQLVMVGLAAYQTSGLEQQEA